MPFKNLSTNPENDYLVDGLTDGIIGSLAVVQGLQVNSHTFSFAFKDKPRDLQQNTKQLGANLIVEGSARRDGNRLRVSVQLIQVDGDTPLWTDTFDRELEAIFSIQDDI